MSFRQPSQTGRIEFDNENRIGNRNHPAADRRLRTVRHSGDLLSVFMDKRGRQILWTSLRSEGSLLCGGELDRQREPFDQMQHFLHQFWINS